MEIELQGYEFSVYTWIVRFVLFEKDVEYRTEEVDPFSENGNPAHPFGKVPLLTHNGFRIYETNAITRYIDHVFPEPSFQPAVAHERARSDQIINIIDGYGYWPLVRQVCSHGYFREVLGLDADPSQLIAGLKSAPKVLAALDDLTTDQGVIKTGKLSLADIHMGPMISYFLMAPDGAELFKNYHRLCRWWDVMSTQPGLEETKPKLPKLG